MKCKSAWCTLLSAFVNDDAATQNLWTMEGCWMLLLHLILHSNNNTTRDSGPTAQHALNVAGCSMLRYVLFSLFFT